MATNQQKGNCYLCGVELGKVAMKNHILKQHSDPAGEQECCLIKVEGMDKRYWLLLDAPTTASLKNLDDFLRRIWLECCGHMSAFMGDGYQEFPMSRRLSAFPEGSRIGYEYDFGDTTRLLVSLSAPSAESPRSWWIRRICLGKSLRVIARPARRSRRLTWTWPCPSQTPPAWAYAPMRENWITMGSMNTRSAIRSESRGQVH